MLQMHTCYKWCKKILTLALLKIISFSVEGIASTWKKILVGVMKAMVIVILR